MQGAVARRNEYRHRLRFALLVEMRVELITLRSVRQAIALFDRHHRADDLAHAEQRARLQLSIFATARGYGRTHH